MSMFVPQIFKVPLRIQSVDATHPLAVDSLLDSGTTEIFIDAEFVKAEKFQTHLLPHVISVYNIDDTPNEGGSIEEEVDLI